MRDDSSNLWVIVLAAGQGQRLGSLTTNGQGVSVPKQFCSFGRDRCMLRWALDRAQMLAPADRVLTVVAREHQHWWKEELVDLPSENVIVQPRNRGTAAGILLPVVEILRRDRLATVMVLPSDHYVEDEETLERSLRRAAAAAEADPERALLLGIAPEDVDTEYGWILPEACVGGDDDEAIRAVDKFVEKPDTTVAAELMLQGALWNSFMFAARGALLLSLYARALPEVLIRFRARFGNAHDEDSLYESLPVRDFSRDLLERVTDKLALVPVPSCGWTDLGTPARLLQFLRTARTTK